VASVTAAVPLPRPSRRFVAAVAAAPALLGIAHLLPETGAGLALRLAAAGAIVLLLPGGLVVRALGPRDSLGVAAAAALAWSLAVVFLAMLLTFAAEANLSLAVAVLVVVTVAILWPAAATAVPAERDRADRLAVLAVAAAGIALAGVVWWAAGPVTGDGLFHLARVRKLEDFEILYSVRAANEFVDGGLHPGYAFPLWHSALALVARLAGVDPSAVVGSFGALLVPLALVVGYGAGKALFRSPAGGVAAVAVQVAQLGFARGGTGSFGFLALPATVSRLLLVPAVLALTFALATRWRWSLLSALIAAGAALAVVHPTYALFLALPLGGFLAARIILSPGDRRGVAGIACSLAALLVPFAGYTLWILPVLNSTVARGEKDRARAIAHYAGQIDPSGDGYRLAPEAIARGGAVVVAALLAVPLAVLAARRLWAALVLGGTLAVLAVVLWPALFTPLADATSLSQGRRLAIFLPLSFALAGAALLAGRLRLAGVAAALAAGIVLQAVYPGEFAYRLGEGGPGWAVWVALFGGAAAFAAGALLQRHGPDPTRWGALAAIAFVLPIAVTGLADVEKDDRPDPYALTPGLVQELGKIERRRVVLSNLETSYRIGAYATLYVAANPPAHVARTKLNRPYQRRRDVIRFFFREDVGPTERFLILEEYIAHAVVVDKTRRYPAKFFRFLYRAYEDERYILYLVHPPR